MGYIIAFIISVVVALYILCDSLFQRKSKKVKKQGTEEASVKVQERIKTTDDKLSRFLRDHLYKATAFDFRQLKGSTNGYYYEKEGFSITIFEYSSCQTAQFFQVNPYKQLASMRLDKKGLQEMEVVFTSIPSDLKGSVRRLFESVNGIDLKSLHSTGADDEIKHLAHKVNVLVEKLEQESSLLSSDMKYAIRRMKKVELVEIMERYHSLGGFELGSGKIKVKEELLDIESRLTVQWKIMIKKKKEEFERFENLMEEA